MNKEDYINLDAKKASDISRLVNEDVLNTILQDIIIEAKDEKICLHIYTSLPNSVITELENRGFIVLAIQKDGLYYNISW